MFKLCTRNWQCRPSTQQAKKENAGHARLCRNGFPAIINEARRSHTVRNFARGEEKRIAPRQRSTFPGKGYAFIAMQTARCHAAKQSRSVPTACSTVSPAAVIASVFSAEVVVRNLVASASSAPPHWHWPHRLHPQSPHRAWCHSGCQHQHEALPSPWIVTCVARHAVDERTLEFLGPLRGNMQHHLPRCQ